MSVLVYENTAKAATGKTGIIRPDANGYYQVLLGAFRIHNASGSYYDDASSVRKLFTSSSELMNRVNNGRLYGEWGHPKWTPGMTERDYLLKLLTVHEEQISHHIKKLELDDNFKSPEGGTCLAVYGWVKPFGPKEAMIREALNNPDQNACFSIRSISRDTRLPNGKVVKTIVKIGTWDGVGEPGIDIADKYHNPGLESRHTFSLTDVEAAMELAETRGSGLESAKAGLNTLYESLRKDIPPSTIRMSGLGKTEANRWLNWGKH